MVSSVPLVVWFDDDCGVCSAAVRFLQSRVDRSVTFRPNRELADPRLVERSDVALLVIGPRGLEEGRAAVAAVLDRCRGWGPLASAVLALPGIAAVGDLVYARVAANRPRISAWLGLPAGCALPTESHS